MQESLLPAIFPERWDAQVDDSARAPHLTHLRLDLIDIHLQSRPFRISKQRPWEIRFHTRAIFRIVLPITTGELRIHCFDPEPAPRLEREHKRRR